MPDVAKQLELRPRVWRLRFQELFGIPGMSPGGKKGEKLYTTESTKNMCVSQAGFRSQWCYGTWLVQTLLNDTKANV